MLGVEDYGSDVESDSDNEQQIQSTATSKNPSAVTKTTSSLNLPKPTNGAPSSSSKLSLPAPKSSSTSTTTTTTSTKRGPKKITIGLPSLTAAADDDAVADDLADQPPAKKPRLDPGKAKGTSSLLSMLPAPKNKNSEPAKQVQAERVLGGGRGGGLVFASSSASTSASEAAPGATSMFGSTASILEGAEREEREEEREERISSLPFLPASLKKGRTNVSVEEDVRSAPTSASASSSSSSSTSGIAKKVTAAPAVDFFSLNPSSSSSSPSHLPPSTSPTSSSTPSHPPPKPTLKSSAPSLPTFTPPVPTPQDPYPGYYQTPTGSWALHDPSYYASFQVKWQKEYDDYVRALERGKIPERGFEGMMGMDEGQVGEVDAQREMERARKEVKELEERRDLTRDKGAPAMPKMKLTAAKQTGIARSRHQLSTLLTEAYLNREALEEKIAQGKRNRKEAGNRYGF